MTPDSGAGAVKDIEEGRDAYCSGGFRPVYIGDVYNGRYEVLNKLGYGAYSTVWLVRDLRKSTGATNQFVALKILSAEAYGSGKDIFEREILRHLRSRDPNQAGYNDFEHEGPNGLHVCLVFEAAGETLRSFGAWFPESRIPVHLMRKFTIQLLLGVDFAHDHNVIHTDIQPNNIFVKIRDPTLIEFGYLKNVPIPEQDRNEEQYTVVPSWSLRNDYFHKEDSLLGFDIAVGDWGVSSWTNNHLTEVIQPIALRAPEVLIGAPWDATADWWNLGAVVLELLSAVRMFDAGASRGQYSLKQHLAEIVHLFGPFPQSFLDKANKNIIDGIFDDTGRVKNFKFSSDRPTLSSVEFFPGLDQETRDEVVAFLQSMMRIDPKERPSAEDLLKGRWMYAL